MVPSYNSVTQLDTLTSMAPNYVPQLDTLTSMAPNYIPQFDTSSVVGRLFNLRSVQTKHYQIVIVASPLGTYH